MARTTVVRVVIVLLIVVPPLGLFQRSARLEKRVHRDEREFACAQIVASETLIRVAAESPPALFTARDRLLLTRFVQDAGRKLQASVPSC